MSITNWLRILIDRRSWAVWRVVRQLRPYYRALYVAGLTRSGMIDMLADRWIPFETLSSHFCPKQSEREHEALDAWLRLGISLGELSRSGKSYRLRGVLSRSLAASSNDSARALLLSLTGVHYRFLTSGPERLRNGDWLKLSEHDGEIVARSSRTVESLVCSVIDRVLAKRGPVKLLEVGCGSGVYIRYAASRNPELTALGLDLDPDVAEAARRNLNEWDVASRARVVNQDIRELNPSSEFDVVTLFNCVYYFPVKERSALFDHIRKFLRPGGQLLLTSWFRGGGVGGEGINFWFALTEGCGRLPDREELATLLRRAGFSGLRSWSLLPGEHYLAFSATA